MTLPASRARASLSPLWWTFVLVLGACSYDAPTHESLPAPTPERASAPPLAPKADATPALDSSCAADADCEVKDVGNCCGRMPACVNRSSQPDPAKVQADCAREGRSGICGFQELSGCQCVDARCVGIPTAGDGGDVR